MEPRLLFSGLAAAIKLDLNFGQGGFAPLSESGEIVTNNIASIATSSQGDFYVLRFSFGVPNDSGSIIRYRSNGSIDAAFGTGGTLTIPPSLANLASASQVYRGIFATASGATLFNPDGTSSVFEDANTIARL